MKDNKIKALKSLSLMGQVGITMVLPIVAGVYIGNYFDKKLQSGNILMIIGILLGVVSGFLNVYKIIIKSINKK